jgi:hypothetical protein
MKYISSYICTRVPDTVSQIDVSKVSSATNPNWLMNPEQLVEQNATFRMIQHLLLLAGTGGL